VACRQLGFSAIGKRPVVAANKSCKHAVGVINSFSSCHG
jgi:hypothetical protein